MSSASAFTVSLTEIPTTIPGTIPASLVQVQSRVQFYGVQFYAVHHACMATPTAELRGHADTHCIRVKQQEHAGQKACPPIPGPACQPAQTLRRGQLAGRRGWSEPEGADQARWSQLTGTVGGRTVDG